jgi:hypothetical protein
MEGSILISIGVQPGSECHVDHSIGPSRSYVNNIVESEGLIGPRDPQSHAVPELSRDYFPGAWHSRPEYGVTQSGLLLC